MNASPLVTVVIPTWNRAELIGETVASIAAQTYENWEIVVADDGSTDGTVEQLAALALPHLRIVRLEHSGNTARVRNAGVAAGSGTLIAFLDSDDLWLPSKLERQVEALRAGSARWCYGAIAHIDRAGTRIPFRAGGARPISGRILPHLLSDRIGASIVTLLVERGLYDEIGGSDESQFVRADLDLVLRLAAAAEAVAVPEVVALVREHESRTTAGLRYPHELTAQVYAKFLDREAEPKLRKLARARRARLLADAGIHRLRLQETRKGLRLLFAAAAAGSALSYVAARLASHIVRRIGAGILRR
jgi:glycosyltransferase involved in cell wall biosynthesis